MIKKTFAAIILSVSVFSCQKEASKTSDGQVKNDSISKTEPEKDLFKPVDTACSSKNKTEDYIAALQWYQRKTEKEIAQNSPEQNTKLYEDYVKIRDKYTSCLSENLIKTLEEYVNYYSESGELKLPDNIQKQSAELKKGGLKFMEVGEGYTEIWSEPDHYFILFKNKINPDYQDYIKQLAKENVGLYAADAGLVVSFKEVGDRTIFWENFIKKYPESRLNYKAKEMYNNYLADYLFGLDNTPTHEHSDGTIYAENRAEFSRLMKQHPNSNVAKRTKELISLFDAKIPVDKIHKRINITRNY
jgi:hypothetical protein